MRSLQLHLVQANPSPPSSRPDVAECSIRRAKSNKYYVFGVLNSGWDSWSVCWSLPHRDAWLQVVQLFWRSRLDSGIRQTLCRGLRLFHEPMHCRVLPRSERGGRQIIRLILVVWCGFTWVRRFPISVGCALQKRRRLCVI